GATPDQPPADGAVPKVAPGRSDAGRPRWFARPAPLALLVVGVLLAALGVGFWMQRPDDDRRTAAQLTDPNATAGGTSATPGGTVNPSGSPGGSASGAPRAGRSQIRPARTPRLCLTEGRDRTGQYPKEIATQRPCADATPPDTYLKPVTDGLYLIKWQHPVHGPGCLTIRTENPGRDLLEPWNDCDPPSALQLFRFEPTGSTPTAYRIRPSGTDLCVGLRDDDTEVSAEALVEPCTNGADQVFLVDSLPEG
ncbi:RICIN domain-containing protein, partial [Micromonospora tarensis]|nr:hypothetical protein [Micromonospora tarensis]